MLSVGDMPGAGCAFGLSRGKGEGHGLGPSGITVLYHCTLLLYFGHCEAGKGPVALPLSSVHAGGQSHPPLPFDLGEINLEI